LAAQRLLGDERVRSGRTCVDLVVHEMMELEEILVTDSDRPREGLARPSVIKRHLARDVEPCALERIVDAGLLGAVEDRCRDRHARGYDRGGFHKVFRLESSKDLVVELLAVGHLHRFLERRKVALVAMLVTAVLDWLPKPALRADKVGTDNLADVHARTHGERVYEDVEGCADAEERHVHLRHHERDHALVAVAYGLLVARLEVVPLGTED